MSAVTEAIIRRQVEKIQKEREKKARAENGGRPSAVTQNNPETEPNQSTEPALTEEQKAAKEKAEAEQKAAEEAAQKAANAPGSPKSAFTKHLQSLVIERLRDAVSVFDGDRPGSANLHTIPTVAPGPYVSSFLPGGSDISQFIQATPAQIASLMPILRFYMVDNKGNEDEIYFADHTSAANTIKLANQRRAGDIQRALPAKNKRGNNVGIQSFTWDYNNKHEGDKVIEASLQLYFGDLTELMNGNYLQFLFTTGLSEPSAADIGKPKGDGSRRVIKTDAEVQADLKIFSRQERRCRRRKERLPSAKGGLRVVYP